MRKLRSFCYLPKLLVVGVFIVGGVSSPAIAQVEEQTLDELAVSFNNGINNATNAMTLFSGQESVSAGHFRFDSEPGENQKLDVTRIPLQNTFGEEGDKFRPYVGAMLGQAKFSQGIAALEGEVFDFSTITSWTAGLNVGADWTLLEGLKITPEFALLYSRIENNYDFNAESSMVFLTPFNDIFFNWDIDVLTYSPSVAVAYELPIGRATITPRVKYTYLYNNSFDSSSPILDIDSSSHVLRSGIVANIPTGIEVFTSEVGVRPFFTRSDLYKAVEEGLFDHFNEVGSELTFNTKESLKLVEELSLRGSYTWADNFEGWSFGVGYQF